MLAKGFGLCCRVMHPIPSQPFVNYKHSPGGGGSHLNGPNRHAIGTQFPTPAHDCRKMALF